MNARGESHWNARLNWTQVKQIRAKANLDKSNAELARIFGVNKTTVRLIRANATWHDPAYTPTASLHMGRGWKKSVV